MSKFVKGVVKTFKKVGKFVLKVAPYVLAAAAVVFTGGAALGLGFAAGGFSAAVGGFVTGTLGIGGAIGGALTGAVTGAGMGAAVGGILGGKKGLKKGFITGALTGGVLGAVSPASVGIVKDPTSGLWTTKQGLINAANTASKSLSGIKVPGVDLANPSNLGTSTAPSLGEPGSTSLTGAGGSTAAAPPPISSELAGSPDYVAQAGTKGLNAGGALPGTTAAPTVASPIIGATPAPIQPLTGTPAAQAITGSAPGATVVPPAATQAASSGIGGFFNANPALAGNMMTSIGTMLTGGEESAADIAGAKEQAMEDASQFAYGGAYTGANGSPFGNVNYGTPPPLRRGKWFYNPETDKIEEVPV